MRFQPLYFTQRILPLVVVGAVAWTASGLLLAAHVETQIFYGVVGFVAVHVIHALVRGERSAKVLRHNEAVFKNGLSGFLHCSIHRQKLIWHFMWKQANVSMRCAAAFRRFFPHISMRSVFQGHERARAAISAEIWSLNLPSYFSRSSCSDFLTPRASDVDDNARSPQMSINARFRHDGWVDGERRQIRISTATEFTDHLCDANAAVASKATFGEFSSDVCCPRIANDLAIGTADRYQYSVSAFERLRDDRGVWWHGRVVCAHFGGSFVMVLNPTILARHYVSH